MRVWMLLACLFLGLVSCSSEGDRKAERIRAIDQEIELIKTEINTEEKKALNSEIEGEGFMRGDYAQFAEVLEKSEASEERVHELNRRLKALDEEKKKLEAQ